MPCGAPVVRRTRLALVPASHVQNPTTAPRDAWECAPTPCPNADPGTTSALQRIQRTNNAKDRAVHKLRDDQKASHAAV